MRFLSHDVAELEKHVGLQRPFEFRLKGIGGTRFEFAPRVARETKTSQSPRIIDSHPNQFRLLVWICLRQKAKRFACDVADEKKFFFLERAFRELVRQRNLLLQPRDVRRVRACRDRSFRGSRLRHGLSLFPNRVEIAHGNRAGGQGLFDVGCALETHGCFIISTKFSGEYRVKVELGS